MDNPWISLECCEIQHNNILIPPLWMIQGLLKPPVPGEQQSMSAPRQRNQLQENQGRWHSTYIYLIIFGPRTCCVLFDPRKNISTKISRDRGLTMSGIGRMNVNTFYLCLAFRGVHTGKHESNRDWTSVTYLHGFPCKSLSQASGKCHSMSATGI